MVLTITTKTSEAYMARIKVTDLSGNTREIEAPTGGTMMEAITDAGMDDLQAICGGGCNCCTCHIYVDDGWMGTLPAPERDEEFLLEDSDHFDAEKSRLACQVTVTDALNGLKVTIVDEG